MNKISVLLNIKEILTENNLSLYCAESCTGGLISSYLTDVAGSSRYIFSNFTTYSNEAKIKYLKVNPKTLADFGAVSENTAYEMSKGLLDLSGYKGCSLATTGILGPSGAESHKPLGLVYISVGYKDKIKVIKYISKKAPNVKDYGKTDEEIINKRVEIKEDITLKALEEFLKFLQKEVNKV